jgi:hypothetical protein
MPHTEENTLPFIAHDRFKAGLHRGQFRVVMNPALARPYIAHRTRLTAWLVASIALGMLAALSGSSWLGVGIAAFGVAANRLVRYQAPKLVLHLAERDAKVYAEVTQNGVMEVRDAL